MSVPSSYGEILANDDMPVGEIKVNHTPMQEIGDTGLKRAAGILDEEFLPALRGRKAVKVFKEMSLNDPTVSSLLFAIEQLLRQVEWTVTNEDQSPDGQEATEFVESCMDDMSHTWDDMVAEALSFITYGWSWHEIVYKKRVGPWETDPKRRSKHTDGRFGWRKIPIRSQETLLRWVFDEDGGIRAMIQMPPPSYSQRVVPIERSLLFRAKHYKGSPEGQALAMDVPVWTPNGWVNHGDLATGDMIYGADGQIRHVMATQIWDRRSVYRVRFNDGSYIDADESHQWVTQNKYERDWRKPGKIRTTKEIAQSVKAKGGVTNHSVPWAGALESPEQRLPVDPYFLGLWLGDGDSNGSRIACHADDLEETMRLIEDSGYRCAQDRNGGSENGQMISVRHQGLNTQLRAMGVLKNKHVPEAYLRGSIEQRQALLAGLMDSDGTVDADGRCEFVNVNVSLIEGVKHLVDSLGGNARVSLRKGADDNRQETWCVKFTPTFPTFRLGRKQAKVKDVRARTSHYIVEVTHLGLQETMCIETDAPDHLYLAGRSMVPTHNSLLRGAYRPWFFKKRLEEFEAIGVERDLAGMPVARVPSDYMKAQKGTDKHKTYMAFKKMVQNVRRDEHEGLVIPRQFDPETKQDLFDFELMSSGGGRTFDTNALITRYEQRILQTVLADFIMLGNNQTGSYAMHVDKTGIFRAALNTLANVIADTFNRHAIPKLFELNGWKPEHLPTIKPSNVDPPNLTELAGFMTSMSGLGMQFFPDPDLEKYLRNTAHLPELSEEELEMRRAMAGQQQMQQYMETAMGTAGAERKAQMVQEGMTPEQAEMASQQQTPEMMEAEQTGMALAQARAGTNPEVMAAQQKQSQAEAEQQAQAQEMQRGPEEEHKANMAGMELEAKREELGMKQQELRMKLLQRAQGARREDDRPGQVRTMQYDMANNTPESMDGQNGPAGNFVSDYTRSSPEDEVIEFPRRPRR